MDLPQRCGYHLHVFSSSEPLVLTASHLSTLGQQHLPGEMTTPPWPCWASVTSLSRGKAVPRPAPALPPPGLCAHPLFLTSSTEQRPCPRAGAHGSGKDNFREPEKPTLRMRVQGMPDLTPLPTHLWGLTLRFLTHPFLCPPRPHPAQEPVLLRQHCAHLTLCHHPLADVQRATGKRTELQYNILRWFSYFLPFPFGLICCSDVQPRKGSH